MPRPAPRGLRDERGSRHSPSQAPGQREWHHTRPPENPPYGGNGRYPDDPGYADPYGADPYGVDRYGADPYGADPYGADPYGYVHGPGYAGGPGYGDGSTYHPQPDYPSGSGYDDGSAYSNSAYSNGSGFPQSSRYSGDSPYSDGYLNSPGYVEDADYRERTGYGDDPGYDDGRGYQGPPGQGPPGRRRAPGPGRRGPRNKVRFRRTRRFARHPAGRVILAAITVFCCWLAFSVGSALAAPGGGTMASKLSEWARDHYLGPVVTFGEWLTYNPPKTGGKPSFSLALPAGTKANLKYGKHGFKPIIPKRLASPAGAPLPGEGQWRLLETVHGRPAMFSTFLRPDNVHTSYVAGIVSMDQRLLRFQLHPGSQDPGSGFGGVKPWIPPGSRTGLMGTFNGGFRLNVSAGGFYLNGSTSGSLTNGAASLVFYKNGTATVGLWGQNVRMTPDVAGVRQNLKLIVQNGQVPSTVNNNVESSWGATLGGAYYVWRSGVGVTKDGRLVYAYGPALDVATLAGLLQRAGAVDAMQLDINPFWMSFEYYQAGHHPADPTPVNLLPTQQQSAYRYYSVYSRDFTAVYAR